jgi:hypothetical protein
MHKIYLLSLALAFALGGKAQNLTGTWQGHIPDSQFLQINIMHTKKGICGFTFDSVINSQNDYCKTYFDATYNKFYKELYIIGKKFVERKGNHFFINVLFQYKKEENIEYLEEYITEAAKRENFINGDTTKPFKLIKVSNIPTPFSENVYEPCLDKKIKFSKKDTLTTTLIKKDTIITIVNKPDTPQKITTVITEPKVDDRKSNIIKTVKITSPSLTLTLYDNAIVDGDTISVFHNGKLILNRQLLNEKGTDIIIELSKENPHHEIVLFAHNLGSIPPNTALLVIKAGKQRYELRAEADLNKNATLIFEYEPPE